MPEAPLPWLIAVMGPTASGKSALAEALAVHVDAVLVNADAFQVYRGLDIGTAKPADRHRYRLLDLKNPNESFGVGEWLALASAEVASAWERRQSVVVVGGTGLYIRALFESYADLAPPPDPELRAHLERRQAAEGLPALAEELTKRAPEVAARTDLKNPARVRRALERLEAPVSRLEVSLPPFRRLKLGLSCEPHELNVRIAARVHHMVQNGWVQEVERLQQAGYLPEHPGMRAIGYRSLWRTLTGEQSLTVATDQTVLETVRYAKRQRTWLRTEPNLLFLEADASDLVDQALHLVECER